MIGFTPCVAGGPAMAAPSRLIRPMKAILRDHLPDEHAEAYGAEFKWDGVRAITYLDRKGPDGVRPLGTA
jgi:ATP-dependent DNA ligase